MTYKIRVVLGSIFLIFCILLAQSNEDTSTKPSETLYNLDKIRADKTLDDIKNGTTINYSNVIVVGNLDLTDIFLPIEQNITITNSYISGKVIFDFAVFEGYVNLSNTTFLRDASLIGTTFDKEANFSGSQFKGVTILRQTKFNKIGEFSNANFSVEHSLGYEGETNFVGVKEYDRVIDSIKIKNKSESNKEWNWSKFWNLVLRYTSNYARSPIFVLEWSIFIIIIFAVGFWLGNGLDKEVDPPLGSRPNFATILKHFTDAIADFFIPDLFRNYFMNIWGFIINLSNCMEIMSTLNKMNRFLENRGWCTTFMDTFYFSTTVFSGGQPIKLSPIGTYRFLAAIERIVGLIFIALFFVSLWNVMVPSWIK